MTTDPTQDSARVREALEAADAAIDNFDDPATKALIRAALASLTAPKPEEGEAARTYQERVHDWIIACFGEEIGRDKVERNHRFLEEALELVQALGCTADEAHQLVDYVFGRPVGEPGQEVGGVMNTLAALCTAAGLDLNAEAERELARVWTKVEAIRAKQAAKPKHSPLPGPASPAPSRLEPVAITNALEMTGLKTEAELIDMANVGQSLMERIADLVKQEGPFKGWMPADDPAEIVFDLVNHYEEAPSTTPPDALKAEDQRSLAALAVAQRALEYVGWFDGAYDPDDESLDGDIDLAERALAVYAAEGQVRPMPGTRSRAVRPEPDFCAALPHNKEGEAGGR